MEKIFSGRWFHWAAFFIIAASIILAYSNTFHAGFQFDDMPSVVENPVIQSLGNIPAFFKANRGVTTATFAVNYALGGLDPFGYHIFNTAVHILNSAGVYLLLFTTLRLSGWDEARSRKIAFFTAIIFALHPVQTQAVTYITQRMESLASLFYIFAVLFFVKAAGAADASKRRLLYLCVPLFYVLGFYSKEMVFTLPAAILLYDYYFIAKGSARDILSRWPVYAALAILLVFFALHDIRPLGGLDINQEAAKAASPDPYHMKEDPSAGFGVKGISPGEYLFTQFNVLIYYMSLLLFPANQNVDYDFPISKDLFSAPALNPGTVLNIPLLPPAASLLIIIAILASGVYLFIRSRGIQRSKGRLASYFIFWFFILLSPTSSFVPIIDVMFEHRLYLASLGFFAIFVISVEGLTTHIYRYISGDIPGANTR